MEPWEQAKSCHDALRLDCCRAHAHGSRHADRRHWRTRPVDCRGDGRHRIGRHRPNSKPAQIGFIGPGNLQSDQRDGAAALQERARRWLAPCGSAGSRTPPGHLSRRRAFAEPPPEGVHRNAAQSPPDGSLHSQLPGRGGGPAAVMPVGLGPRVSMRGCVGVSGDARGHAAPRRFRTHPDRQRERRPAGQPVAAPTMAILRAPWWPPGRANRVNR